MDEILRNFETMVETVVCRYSHGNRTIPRFRNGCEMEFATIHTVASGKPCDQGETKISPPPYSIRLLCLRLVQWSRSVAEVPILQAGRAPNFWGCPRVSQQSARFVLATWRLKTDTSQASGPIAETNICNTLHRQLWMMSHLAGNVLAGYVTEPRRIVAYLVAHQTISGCTPCTRMAGIYLHLLLPLLLLLTHDFPFA